MEKEIKRVEKAIKNLAYALDFIKGGSPYQCEEAMKCFDIADENLHFVHDSVMRGLKDNV